MPQTAAILYARSGYETSGQRLMGRQAASEGFLKAMSSYGTAENLYCYADSRGEFEEFCQRVKPWLPEGRSVRWVPTANPGALKEPGVLYRPDPVIVPLAWQRRYRDPQAYSLCGITHTLVSKETMATLGDLLIAPMQPWDAVICTSTAVKTQMERMLGDWADYLALRVGARPEVTVQLPVIPLGVDCDRFPHPQTTQEARSRLRQQLGIAPDELVVLFVGRLIFHAKAHPVPMYLALERAAQGLLTKVHLVQAGWFEDTQQEVAFKEGARAFCPSVNAIFVDGRQPQMRQDVWAIADVFISLADNIQETFGLTPIEAMASGLPVVVTDWNGYQDTVRHEVDGFRISTLMPPAGCGLDLAANYQDDSMNYSTFVGHASLATAVDIDACTQALTALLTQPGLRKQMGENGRQRAQEVYDWRVIIAAYEQLWQELTDLRNSRAIVAPLPPNTPPFPLCDDPYRLLQHYPTHNLQGSDVLALGDMATPENLRLIRATWMTSFGGSKRISDAGVDQILTIVSEASSMSVADILGRFGNNEPMVLMYLCRTLVYLIKFGVLRLL